MKLNFLNDESDKFDVESGQDFFETQATTDTSTDENIFEDISFEAPEASAPTYPSEDEFSDAHPKHSKSSFPEEHDIISDESRTHRKLRLSILGLLLLLTAAYLSIDYIDLDQFFASKTDDTPTEYIEIITSDSSKANKIVSTSKKETPINPSISEAIKKPEVEKEPIKTVTKSTISSSILIKSSKRLNQLTTIQNISSFSFVSARLQQIYILNKIIYFEVYSTNRSKLGRFSKALTNQKPSIKLYKSRNHARGGSTGTFKSSVKQTNSADFGQLQTNSEVISIMKQLARANKITILETTKENATSILIRAKGSLKSMSNYLNIVNNSLNNVSLSKLNLVTTKRKSSSAPFLLSIRLNVLN